MGARKRGQFFAFPLCKPLPQRPMTPAGDSVGKGPPNSEQTEPETPPLQDLRPRVRQGHPVSRAEMARSLDPRPPAPGEEGLPTCTAGQSLPACCGHLTHTANALQMAGPRSTQTGHCGTLRAARRGSPTSLPTPGQAAVPTGALVSAALALGGAVGRDLGCGSSSGTSACKETSWMRQQWQDTTRSALNHVKLSPCGEL